MPKIIFQPLMIPNPAERLAEDVKDETPSHQNNNNTELFNLNKHKL